MPPFLYSNNHPEGTYFRGALINKIQVKGGAYLGAQLIQDGVLIQAFTVVDYTCCLNDFYSL